VGYLPGELVANVGIERHDVTFSGLAALDPMPSNVYRKSQRNSDAHPHEAAYCAKNDFPEEGRTVLDTIESANYAQYHHYPD
jgi:hypothetical protein